MNKCLVLLFALSWFAWAGEPVMPVLSEFGDTGPHTRLVKDGNYVYMATWSGIEVFDVTDPDTPVSIANQDTPGASLDILKSGNYLFIADTNQLLVMDVTNPSLPTEVATWTPTGSNLNINRLARDGNWLFLVETTRIIALDITDPENPVPGGVYDAENRINGLDISSDVAYLSIGDLVTGVGAVHIVDMSNPQTPVFQRVVTLPFVALGIKINGSRAYIGNGPFMRIWDLGAQPAELGSLFFSGYFLWRYRLVANLLYAPAQTGVAIIDITNPTAPTLTGTISTSDLSFDLALENDLAYVAGFKSGLNIVDVSTPSSPSLVGSAESGNLASRLVIEGDFGYSADLGPSGTNIMQVVDLSDPLVPAVRGSLSAFIINDMAAYGNYLFIADFQGLRIVDVSDPDNPTQEAIIAEECIDAQVSDDYLYTLINPAEGSDELRIYDLTNPLALQQVGSFRLTTPKSLEVSGSHVFIMDRSQGLVIVDVSNPAQPIRRSRLATMVEDNFGKALKLRLFGDRVFIPFLGLEVIDVSDVANPVSLSFHEGTFNDVLYEQGLLYASHDVNGLTMYEIDGANLNQVETIDTPGTAVALARTPGRVYISDGVSGRHFIHADTLRYSRLLNNWPSATVLDIVTHRDGEAGL